MGGKHLLHPWLQLRHSSRYVADTENRKIYIPHLYSTPSQGEPRRNFVKVFRTGKTIMIGLLYAEESM